MLGLRLEALTGEPPNDSVPPTPPDLGLPSQVSPSLSNPLLIFLFSRTQTGLLEANGKMVGYAEEERERRRMICRTKAGS